MSINRRDTFDNTQNSGLPNVFAAVKQSVTARQAAEMYGLEVKSNGMACCPFHEDTHPSMKLDERYYCFGCNETGDAIDFVSNYLRIGKLEAAKRIAEDFHIPYDTKARSGRGKPMTPEQKSELEKRQLLKDVREWRRKMLNAFAGDYYTLERRSEQLSPPDMDTPATQAFLDALHDQTLLELYNWQLEDASPEDLIDIYRNHRAEITDLHDRINGRKKERTSIREKLEAKKNILRFRQEDKRPAPPQKQREAI